MAKVVIEALIKIVLTIETVKSRVRNLILEEM